MAAQNVCLWNKFGYCKHKECCRKRHVKELCENNTCDILNCIFRHPKNCRYYRDYGKCKFNPCMFLHVKKDRDDDEIVNLRNENESVKKKLETIENEMSELDAKIVKSENIITKLLEVEKKFDKIIDIEKHLYEKDSTIDDLSKKVISFENKLSEKDAIINDLIEKVHSKEVPAGEKRLSKNDSKTLLQKKNILERLQELEKINVDKDEKITNLTLKIEKLESEMKVQYREAYEVITGLVSECEDNAQFDQMTSFSCPECEFVGKHLRGLKIHMTKMHLKVQPVS